MIRRLGWCSSCVRACVIWRMILPGRRVRSTAFVRGGTPGGFACCWAVCPPEPEAPTRRTQMIADLIGRHPLTEAEAEAIRALLPPVRG